MNQEKIDSAFEELKSFLKTKVAKDKSLAPLVTLRTGGNAKLFINVDTFNELRQALLILKKFNLPYFVLGKGSNLLVSDQGFNGAIIKLGKEFGHVQIDGEYIQAGAAVPLPLLVRISLKNSLKGLAFAVGIPGTFGGALALNAGAHGHSISDLVTRVSILSSELELKLVHREEIDFGYRTSSLLGKGVILEGVLQLTKGNFEEIKRDMERYFRKRKVTQPLNFPTAGSIFKNPLGLSAGKLIEEAGCKGWRFGQAQVSTKHANFIVNLGEAKASEIFFLLKKVQDEVRKKKGILLEPEIIMLGDFKIERASGRKKKGKREKASRN